MYDDADALYARAIAIGKTTLHPDHPEVIEWLNNRKMALKKKALGPDHPEVGTMLSNRAALLVQRVRGGQPNSENCAHERRRSI